MNTMSDLRLAAEVYQGLTEATAQRDTARRWVAALAGVLMGVAVWGVL